MSRIIVLGGGIIGLSTAMMLQAQGHDVTVYEGDAEPLPRSLDDAWHAWERRGVAQFRQAHFLLPAARHIIDRHLPGVKEALLRARCTTVDLASLMPPWITDRAPREGDERFVTVTGRRPALEYAIAGTGERLLNIVRGAAVTGLVTGTPAADGIPHITGVRTEDGREHTADLVVDATGRRSQLPDRLEAAGARRPIEESEESGFIYYTRYFRATAGGAPAFRSGLLTHYHTFSLLTLPGDGDTWSVTIFIYSGDPALKTLRDARRWAALVGACPLQAHWLDGEPITDVIPMGGVADRYRRFVVDGAPVATGVVSVGDAWACTNPVGGRGISMGLIHAVGTAEVIEQHLGDPFALALAHDAMTEARVTPWYRATVAFDRQRTAEIAAAIEGRTVSKPADAVNALPVAMAYDPDLFRASVEIQSLLAMPQEVFARPGMVERIMDVAAAHEPLAPPAPSRDDLLRMLA